jgi:hypothetical protein
MVRAVYSAKDNDFTFKINFEDEVVVLRVADLLQN